MCQCACVPYIHICDVCTYSTAIVIVRCWCYFQVLSNFGELQLSQSLLPHEYAYLSDPVHVARAIQAADIHLLGELCHCLFVLGHTEEHEGGQLQQGVMDVASGDRRSLTSPQPLCTGLTYLRATQSLADGSWPARDNRQDSYAR